MGQPLDPEFKKFIEQAKYVRKVQKRYFANRTQPLLEKCLAIEAKFDARIAALLPEETDQADPEPETPKQLDMFDTSEEATADREQRLSAFK